MRFKLPRLRHLFCLAAFVGGSLAASAGADEQQPAPPAAAPKSASVQTPAPETTPKKNDGLKRLEQDLFKPFRGFSSDDSLDGVRNPSFSAPAPNAPQSKHAKELMDRRKNWAFMTPEELITGKAKEDPSETQGKSDEEKEKSLLSPIERYYQSLYLHKPPAKNSPGKSLSGTEKEKSAFDPAGYQDDPGSGSSSSVDENHRTAKKSFDTKSFDTTSGKTPAVQPKQSGFFPDVFALERPKPSSEEEAIDKARLESYKRSLGLAPTPVFNSKPLSPFGDPADPARNIFNPAVTVDSAPSIAKPAGFGIPSAGVASPTLSLSDPGSKNSSVSSFTPALPKVEPPKSSLPPQPTFTAPRRAF
jgi:hypothetical protein